MFKLIMICTLKSKSNHFNLLSFKIPIKNSNQFEVISCNDWLQQTCL